MIEAAAQAPPKRAGRKRGAWARWSGYLFAAPYLILFVGFLVVPLVYGLSLSFYRWELLSRIPPKFVGVTNYKEAFGDAYFWKALWATTRFAVMAVPCTIVLALAMAMGLHAMPLKRQSFYRAAYFLPTILTISVVGVLWRWFFNSEFGMFNAYLGHFGIKVPWITDVHYATKSIVLMTLWWTAAGPMVILLAGLHDIPAQYREAAALDGASSWNQFKYVTFPLLRPVLLFVMVMNVIGSLQVFGQTFLITSGGPELSTRSLVQYIYETAFRNYRMGYAASLSWILFVIIAVFSFGQFRLMRER